MIVNNTKNACTNNKAYPAEKDMNLYIQNEINRQNNFKEVEKNDKQSEFKNGSSTGKGSYG